MTTENCLFCKIIDGDIPADIIHETEHTLAFRDINPQAPTHVLIIPRQHIATINDLQESDTDIVGRLYLAARDIAAVEDMADDGYRVVMNCNKAAGQTVFHLHLHLLGGRHLGWPPG
ncbi:MAG: histidine triad nucleotide-binding protein [Gammaproteobacteria bacterium]|nr:histidine triad nucleotide-binding protein [Gammaproteobacteria bacterium]